MLLPLTSVILMLVDPIPAVPFLLAIPPMLFDYPLHLNTLAPSVLLVLSLSEDKTNFQLA